MSKKFAGRVAARVILAAAAIVFMLACDNPFQTRRSEPPSKVRGSFIAPLTPEVVLVNLRNAVIEQNLVNYARCLADPARSGSFAYEAEPAVANAQRELFENWNLDNERRYFSQLSAVLPPDSARSLTFISQAATTLGDSAIFVEDYELTVRHTQQATGIPSRYAGQARLTLRRDNLGEWAIHRWADFSTGGLPTWSALKASFGQ